MLHCLRSGLELRRLYSGKCVCICSKAKTVVIFQGEQNTFEKGEDGVRNCNQVNIQWSSVLFCD